jgi:C-terminal processing protease CtpA/Prc/Tol biopolymer transport system component
MPDGRHLLTVTVGESTPSSSKLDEPIPPIQDTPARTPNLWLFDLEGAGRPVTTFVGGGVRSPSVAATSADIAFEYGQDLWFLRSGRKKPEKIGILVAADEKQTTRRREKLTSGVIEAEPSPDGKTFAFGLRGDIWTIPIDKSRSSAAKNTEFARRLTEWVGDDSDFAWSPKGKTLYFTSDREFNTRLYELDLDTLKVTSLWERTEDVTGPHLSPDGKQIGLWVAGRDGGLFVLDLKTREPRRVVRLPGPQWRGVGGGDFAWSPDMKWIAYSHRGGSGAYNLWIVPAAGGEPVNVTRLFAHHSQPVWSTDGKFLFFQSNRDGEGLYALALTREVGRSANGEVKFEKPTNTVEVQIEFDDLSRRIRKLTSQNPGSDLTVTSEGLIVFLSDNDVWSVTYDGKETKRLTTGGGKQSLRVSKDGRRAFFIQGTGSNAELYTMGLDGKSPEKVAFTAEWERDVRAERQAAFTQFWRSYHRAFYDANFHGRDWNAIRERYEPMLDAVETNEEFASLLQMMIGELETSHAELTPANSPGSSPVTPVLGFTIDYSHPGPGLKVAEVPEGAPGWFRKTQIREGEYVLAINGRDVRLDERLYEWINDKQDREFEFLVSTNTEKKFARTVKYKPLSADDWSQLNYRNRIARLRRHVEDESKNRIGYLHIPAMMQKDQVQFEKEAYEYVVDKEAMIIDVRFNSGGNIADTLIDWLERKPFGYLRVRDADKVPSPRQSWDKPIVVLMNEHSYSNGEIFPYAMRARGLAKLVGMPTPGYVIWTYPLKLVDGTGARMPESGFYRLDGTPQENNGERPDIQVPLSPDDWVAGRDPQLEKAIELLTAPPASTPAAAAEDAVEP